MAIFIDFEIGEIDEEDFHALDPDEQKELMLAWFRERFEDPSNETPRMDGEFQYIWGGPYEAGDQLYSTFGDIARDDTLDELVTELRQEAGDWAPTSRYHEHDDEGVDQNESAERLNIGTDEELVLRREVLDRLERIEQGLVEASSRQGQIGHNRPPLEFRDVDGLEQLAESVRILKADLEKPTPSPNEVAEHFVAAKQISASVFEHLGIFTKNFAEAFGKSFGSTLGKAAGAAAGGTTLFYSLHAEFGELFHHIDLWMTVVGH